MRTNASRRRNRDLSESYLQCVECSALYIVEPEELEGVPRVVGCSTCLHEWYASEGDLLWGEEEALAALEREGEVGRRKKDVNERVSEIVEDSDSGAGIVVFVGNLSYRATNADVQRAFSGYGAVIRCQVVMHASGVSKGFAFVEMTSREAGLRAIAELHGASIMGRDISLRESNRSKNERLVSRGGRGYEKTSRTQEKAQKERRLRGEERLEEESNGMTIGKKGIEGRPKESSNKQEDEERPTGFYIGEDAENSMKGTKSKSTFPEGKKDGTEQMKRRLKEGGEEVDGKKEGSEGETMYGSRDKDGIMGSRRRMVRGKLETGNELKDGNASVARRGYFVRGGKSQKEAPEKQINSKTS